MNRQIQTGRTARRPSRPSLLSVFRSRRSVSGSAMVETAIVMPLYMIVVFGLLYFGYVTLARQRQAVSAAYAAWMPSDQPADELYRQFWPWAGAPALVSSSPGYSDATAGDTRMILARRNRAQDEYYRVYGIVPTQLTAGLGSLDADGGAGVFDRERVCVSLWNYALGDVHRNFDWKPGGITPNVSVSYDDMAAYLNVESSSAAPRGGGFIAAGDAAPPQMGVYQAGADLSPELVADALTGPARNGPRWMERTNAKMEVQYNPPFLNVVRKEPSEATPGFKTFVTAGYAAAASNPSNMLEFDVTRRGEAARLAIGDAGRPAGANAPGQLLDEVAGRLFRQGMPAPVESTAPLGSVGGAALELKDAYLRR